MKPYNHIEKTLYRDLLDEHRTISQPLQLNSSSPRVENPPLGPSDRHRMNAFARTIVNIRDTPQASIGARLISKAGPLRAFPYRE